MSARNLSHGTSRSIASSGSPFADIAASRLSASKNPNCPILASANHRRHKRESHRSAAGAIFRGAHKSKSSSEATHRQSAFGADAKPGIPVGEHHPLRRFTQGRTALTDKRNEIPTAGLLYPMVDLFTGGIVLRLMFVNAVTTWCLLSITAPSLLTQAWVQQLDKERNASY